MHGISAEACRLALMVTNALQICFKSASAAALLAQYHDRMQSWVKACNVQSLTDNLHKANIQSTLILRTMRSLKYSLSSVVNWTHTLGVLD